MLAEKWQQGLSRTVAHMQKALNADHFCLRLSGYELVDEGEDE